MVPIMRIADTATWSKELQDLVFAEQVAVIPYDLEMEYRDWSYRTCVKEVLHSSGIVLN